MPDNGVLLVFTDNGSHQLELENAVKEKSEKKNVKILFAILTTPGVVDTASMEVYDHLSNGQIFYASSADGSDMVDIKAFFEAVVNTVRLKIKRVNMIKNILYFTGETSMRLS